MKKVLNCIKEKCENPRVKNIFSGQFCKVCYKENEYEIASVILSLRESTSPEKVNQTVIFNPRLLPFCVALFMLIILLANSFVVGNISIFASFVISLSAYFLYSMFEVTNTSGNSGRLFPEKKLNERKIKRDFNQKKLNLETKLEHLYKRFGGSIRHQKLLKEHFEGLSISQIKQIIKNYKT